MRFILTTPLTSLTVPVSDRKFVLITWQQIFHLERDVGGRERTIVVTVIEDERQSTHNWNRVSAMVKRAPARRRPRKAEAGRRGSAQRNAGLSRRHSLWCMCRTQFQTDLAPVCTDGSQNLRLQGCASKSMTQSTRIPVLAHIA